MANREPHRRAEHSRLVAEKIPHCARSPAELASASIFRVLERVLLLSGGCGAMELSELNTLATVIQRLIVGFQQAAELSDHEREWDKAEGKSGLSKEALREIESQLHLLC
ncbi:MAG: hypothetical protein LBH53_02145 [Puniceicoccales bacterium]|jgi:hypothetical protein|nr:hypothetical protein [Puniceicoccales bacterium]